MSNISNGYNDSFLFTIVIPTYNRADLLRVTINSILQQSYPNFELLIIDDGSTDNTKEVVSSFSDWRIKYYEKINGERGAARNYGTQLSNGAYINFFDSDDLMLPNHLEAALEIIRAYRSPEVLHVNFETRDSEGNLIKPAKNFQDSCNEYLIISNDLACNSVFVRQDIAIQHPFNESRVLTTAEDWELWLRLAARYTIYYTNAVTHYQIEHRTRSLNEIDPDRIIQRDEYLLQVMLSDKLFRDKFYHQLPRFIADRYTFISLQLSLTKYRRIGTIKYLMKAMRADISVVLRRRFLASIKHWF